MSNSSCCAFASQIYLAHLKSSGRACKVSIYKHFCQESSSFSCHRTVIIAKLPGAQHCCIGAVNDLESGLVQLLLTIYCTDSVMAFLYSQSRDDFVPFKTFEVAGTSPETFVVSDSVLWATVVKKHHLRVYHSGGVNDTQLPFDATSILHVCALQFITETGEQDIVSIHVLATLDGIKFVAVRKDSRYALSEKRFVPELYSANICAVSVNFADVVTDVPDDYDVSTVLSSSLSNYTLACTLSGSLLLFKNGRVTARCVLPYKDANRIHCIRSGTRVNHAIIQSPADGACIVRADDQSLTVMHTFPQNYVVTWGDLLRQGLPQAVGFVAGQVLSDVQWCRLDGVAANPTVTSSGLKDITASLQTQCCVGQSTLDKTNRTIAETDVLIESLTSKLRAKNISERRLDVLGKSGDARAVGSNGLVPIFPLGPAAVEELLEEDELVQQTSLTVLSSWAHFYGPRLLLGWVFERPLEGIQPDVHVACPDVTFDVRADSTPDRLTVATCCPLPSAETIEVTVLVDFHVHSCTVDLLETTSVSRPTAETVASLRSQHFRYDLTIGTHLAPLGEDFADLAGDTFRLVSPGVYFCELATSVLYEVNFDLQCSSETRTDLQVYAVSPAQYSAFERWLSRILPDDARVAPPAAGPADLRADVTSGLLREAELLRAVLNGASQEYATLRRRLLSAECDTDEAVLRLLHRLPKDSLARKEDETNSR